MLKGEEFRASRAAEGNCSKGSNNLCSLLCCSIQLFCCRQIEKAGNNRLRPTDCNPHEQRPQQFHLGVYSLYVHKPWYQISTSLAQLSSQFFSLCFFKLGNASHRFWTQDVATPVTTDLQRRENKSEPSYHQLSSSCTRVGATPQLGTPTRFLSSELHSGSSTDVTV